MDPPSVSRTSAASRRTVRARFASGSGRELDLSVPYAPAKANSRRGIPHVSRAVVDLLGALGKAHEAYREGNIQEALNQYEVAVYFVGRWNRPRGFEVNGISLDALRKNYETLKALAAETSGSR